MKNKVSRGEIKDEMPDLRFFVACRPAWPLAIPANDCKRKMDIKTLVCLKEKKEDNFS